MPIYKMTGGKDGKQKYRVRINYTDRNGTPHQIDRVAYGSTEAKILESKLQQEYSISPAEKSSRITVRELFDLYQKSRKNDVRIASHEKTKRIFDGNILDMLGDVRIDRLSAGVLQEWKNRISDKGIGIRTQQNIYSEFRAMLNYAVKLEMLQRNPLLLVGNFKNTDFTPPNDKLNYYTVKEFELYIAAAKHNAENNNTFLEWCYYVFFAVAYLTGMRKGEINALKWSDIDGNIINIRRSVTQKVKGKAIVETPPKNKSSYRSLQIPVPLIQILQEHKERQKIFYNNKFSDDMRVCGGESCLRDSNLSNKNKQFAKMAEIKCIRIHDFRHSHVSLLANEGINIQEIARRLGHAKIEMTWNTYSHLYPREEERALKVLDTIKL